MEASVAAPSQGAPPPAAQPPSAGGQGSGGAQPTAGQGNFNWGLFPNVPESQRELLQPHLTNVLGHVTQMEQRYAPYKGLVDSVSPEDVDGLLQFLQGYSNDPLSTVTGLVGQLHKNGRIQNPEFSIEQLQSLLQGQQGGAPAAAQPGTDDMPSWAQELRQQVAMLAQGEQQRQQQAQQQAAQAQMAENQRILGEGISIIREQLKAAGVPEVRPDNSPFITDQQIQAALIVHEGDVQQVVGHFTGLRDGFLTDFTQQNGAQPRPASMPGGAPQTPQQGLKGKKGDSFRQASVGAEQFLRQKQQAAAQG